MIDRTTEFLLAAIALGVWANYLSHDKFVRSALAQNDDYYLQQIDSKIGSLINGVCINSKLC
jgi:hypothetical protein